MFAALGVAVSSPLSWYAAAVVLSLSGALLGVVWCWRAGNVSQ